jgi:hypothetical protein
LRFKNNYFLVFSSTEKKCSRLQPHWRCKLASRCIVPGCFSATRFFAVEVGQVKRALLKMVPISQRMNLHFFVLGAFEAGAYEAGVFEAAAVGTVFAVLADAEFGRLAGSDGEGGQALDRPVAKRVHGNRFESTF